MAVLGRLWIVFILLSIVLSVVRAFRRARTGGRAGSRRNPGGRRSQAGYAGQPARSAYEVLEVRPGASEEEITSAYYRLVQMYHPDKVADMAPEFREVAEERMKEINAAYEEFKRGNWR